MKLNLLRFNFPSKLTTFRTTQYMIYKKYQKNIFCQNLKKKLDILFQMKMSKCNELISHMHRLLLKRGKRRISRWISCLFMVLARNSSPINFVLQEFSSFSLFHSLTDKIERGFSCFASIILVCAFKSRYTTRSKPVLIG